MSSPIDFTVQIIGDFEADSPEEAAIQMAEWLAADSDLTMRVSWFNNAGHEESTYMDLGDAFKLKGEGT
jgi:hypothetical protein